jgi:hypothetical protein
MIPLWRYQEGQRLAERIREDSSWMPEGVRSISGQK